MSEQIMRNNSNRGIPRTIFGTEHELFRNTVRRFLKTEIVPYHEQWEDDRLVPREAWLKAGKTGLLGTSIAEEYGGSGGGFLFDAVVLEERVLPRSLDRLIATGRADDHERERDQQREREPRADVTDRHRGLRHPERRSPGRPRTA